MFCNDTIPLVSNVQTTMTEHVLAPIGSFTPWARAIAHAITDVEDPKSVVVTLLHVETEPDETTDTSEASLDQRARNCSSVSTVAEIIGNSGFDVTIHGRAADNLGEAILNTAETRETDRLYMHARRRSPTGKAVYGSTIQHVLTNAPVPVVVVPSSAIGSLT